MNEEALRVAALVVQSLSVVAAVVASIIALRIAAGNRRASLRQSHLMFELDAAVRLAENQARGGTATGADAATLERERLGGEAMAMIGALGPGRLPAHWVYKFESEEVLRANLVDDGTPSWMRDAIEAQLAIIAILRDIAAEEAWGSARQRVRRRLRA